MQRAPIRIVLADDHEIFRDGFRVMCNKIPSIQLIGEAEDGERLVEMVTVLQPDVVITDINMPRMDGVQAAKILNEAYPEIGIIALSMFDEEHLIVDMLEAGARGYLIKNAQKEEITEAIQAVFKNEKYYCTSTSIKLAKLIANSRTRNTKAQRVEFTEKEKIIIQYICQELSNKEIGEKLQLSKRTVEGYREKILEKIDAKNTAGIVVYAIKNEIYQVPPDASSF